MPENKSAEKKMKESGKITVSKEVVATIAALETMKNKGVVGIASGYKGKSVNILPKNDFAKGVEVWISSGEATVTISIITHYEAGIYKVATEVQKKVKDSLQSMTGLKVLKVNINVLGVKFKEKEKKPVIKIEKPEK
jgi:uncharacterized alkaline shock family protein YloU